MIIASPDVIFLTTRPLYEEDDYVYMDCTYSWPEDNTKIYQLCIVTLLFVLPFVLMTISYSHIVNVLWRNETMTESVQHSFHVEQEEQQIQKKKYDLVSRPTAQIEFHQNSNHGLHPELNNEACLIADSVVVIDRDGDAKHIKRPERKHQRLSDKLANNASAKEYNKYRGNYKSSFERDNGPEEAGEKDVEAALKGSGKHSYTSAMRQPNSSGKKRKQEHQDLQPSHGIGTKYSGSIFLANCYKNSWRHTKSSDSVDVPGRQTNSLALSHRCASLIVNQDRKWSDQMSQNGGDGDRACSNEATAKCNGADNFGTTQTSPMMPYIMSSDVPPTACLEIIPRLRLRPGGSVRPDGGCVRGHLKLSADMGGGAIHEHRPASQIGSSNQTKSGAVVELGSEQSMDKNKGAKHFLPTHKDENEKSMKKASKNDGGFVERQSGMLEFSVSRYNDEHDDIKLAHGFAASFVNPFERLSPIEVSCQKAKHINGPKNVADFAAYTPASRTKAAAIISDACRRRSFAISFDSGASNSDKIKRVIRTSQRASFGCASGAFGGARDSIGNGADKCVARANQELNEADLFVAKADSQEAPKQTFSDSCSCQDSLGSSTATKSINASVGLDCLECCECFSKPSKCRQSGIIRNKHPSHKGKEKKSAIPCQSNYNDYITKKNSPESFEFNDSDEQRNNNEAMDEISSMNLRQKRTVTKGSLVAANCSGKLSCICENNHTLYEGAREPQRKHILGHQKVKMGHPFDHVKWNIDDTSVDDDEDSHRDYVNSASGAPTTNHHEGIDYRFTGDNNKFGFNNDCNNNTADDTKPVTPYNSTNRSNTSGGGLMVTNDHHVLNQTLPSSSSTSNRRFYKLIESRKKAAKMLIVIVIMFGLCYLPIHFLNILR